MTLLQILILAVVQGIGELLPVSSSAHVIMAEKMMGLDPTAPEMTLLLVMLHTGTMLAVILYFWKAWRRRYFSSTARFVLFAKEVMVALVLTGVVG
jgi:undecaprenyl-diphosphatase